MKHCKRILEFLLSVLTALTIFSCVSWAADDFEKSLEGFPESYRVKLRELHTQFPNWRFVPLMTGLDWDEAVTMEASDKRSLVSKLSAYFFGVRPISRLKTIAK